MTTGIRTQVGAHLGWGAGDRPYDHQTPHVARSAPAEAIPTDPTEALRLASRLLVQEGAHRNISRDALSRFFTDTVESYQSPTQFQNRSQRSQNNLALIHQILRSLSVHPVHGVQARELLNELERIKEFLELEATLRNGTSFLGTNSFQRMGALVSMGASVAGRAGSLAGLYFGLRGNLKLSIVSGLANAFFQSGLQLTHAYAEGQDLLNIQIVGELGEAAIGALGCSLMAYGLGNIRGSHWLWGLGMFAADVGTEYALGKIGFVKWALDLERDRLPGSWTILAYGLVANALGEILGDAAGHLSHPLTRSFEYRAQQILNTNLQTNPVGAGILPPTNEKINPPALPLVSQFQGGRIPAPTIFLNKDDAVPDFIRSAPEVANDTQDIYPQEQRRVAGSDLVDGISEQTPQTPAFLKLVPLSNSQAPQAIEKKDFKEAARKMSEPKLVPNSVYLEDLLEVERKRDREKQPVPKTKRTFLKVLAHLRKLMDTLENSKRPQDLSSNLEKVYEEFVELVDPEVLTPPNLANETYFTIILSLLSRLHALDDKPGTLTNSLLSALVRLPLFPKEKFEAKILIFIESHWSNLTFRERVLKQLALDFKKVKSSHGAAYLNAKLLLSKFPYIAELLGLEIEESNGSFSHDRVEIINERFIKYKIPFRLKKVFNVIGNRTIVEQLASDPSEVSWVEESGPFPYHDFYAHILGHFALFEILGPTLQKKAKQFLKTSDNSCTELAAFLDYVGSLLNLNLKNISESPNAIEEFTKIYISIFESSEEKFNLDLDYPKPGSEEFDSIIKMLQEWKILPPVERLPKTRPEAKNPISSVPCLPILCGEEGLRQLFSDSQNIGHQLLRFFNQIIHQMDQASANPGPLFLTATFLSIAGVLYFSKAHLENFVGMFAIASGAGGYRKHLVPRRASTSVLAKKEEKFLVFLQTVSPVSQAVLKNHYSHMGLERGLIQFIEYPDYLLEDRILTLKFLATLQGSKCRTLREHASPLSKSPLKEAAVEILKMLEAGTLINPSTPIIVLEELNAPPALPTAPTARKATAPKAIVTQIPSRTTKPVLSIEELMHAVRDISTPASRRVEALKLLEERGGELNSVRNFISGYTNSACDALAHAALQILQNRAPQSAGRMQIPATTVVRDLDFLRTQRPEIPLSPEYISKIIAEAEAQLEINNDELLAASHLRELNRIEQFAEQNKMSEILRRVKSLLGKNYWRGKRVK